MPAIPINVSVIFTFSIPSRKAQKAIPNASMKDSVWVTIF